MSGAAVTEWTKERHDRAKTTLHYIVPGPDQITSWRTASSAWFSDNAEDALSEIERLQAIVDDLRKSQHVEIIQPAPLPEEIQSFIEMQKKHITELSIMLHDRYERIQQQEIREERALRSEIERCHAEIERLKSQLCEADAECVRLQSRIDELNGDQP